MTRLCPPAPPAARPSSLRRPFCAPLGHPGRTSRGRVERRVAFGLGGWRPGGVAFPNPLGAPRLLSCRSEAPGNISVLSTVDSPRPPVPRGHGPPEGKGDTPPCPRQPGTTRTPPSELQLPKAGWRGAAAVLGQQEAATGRVPPAPPKFSLCPGRGLCPSLQGDALPRARLVGRAGGARD